MNKKSRIVLLVSVIIAVFIIAIVSYTNRRLTVVLDPPVVVAQNEDSYNNGTWGFFQFPKLYYTDGGIIVCKVANHSDSVEEYSGDYFYYISEDKGTSWRKSDNVPYDCSVLMSNHCYFQGPMLKDAYSGEVDLKENYNCIYSSVDESIIMYYSFMLQDAEKYNCFESYEYNPDTFTTNTFVSSYQWNYVPVEIDNGLIYPAGIGMYPFGMHTSGCVIKENADTLYAAIYCWGGDDSGKIPFPGHSNIYCFRSTDSARTWEYVTSILACQPDLPDESIGLTEPCMTILPDKTYFMLMRTGTGKSCYFSRSFDGGNSWTKPEPFSDIGVAPQLLTMTNGITIASYGRPGIRIRVTEDESAGDWENEIMIDEFVNDTMENTFSNSCSYTSLIELDRNTAMIAYSNFRYPDRNDSSKNRKTILVRKIHFKYDYMYWFKKFFFCFRSITGE